ncbi:hypothetical protein KI387_032485, partial [Taxus chinensis]
MMAALTSSSEDFVIPIEWVDDVEFQAIENALAQATSAYKRLKTSHPDAKPDIQNADSVGRRLPGWAQNSSNSRAYHNSDENLYSVNNTSNNNQAAEHQRFETRQFSSLSHSWLFSRPHYRPTPKPIVPKINFGGRIVYSRLQSEVEKASMELLQIVNSKKSNIEGRVPMGLDLEWKPFYNRPGEIFSKAAVLQICLDANRCDVMHIIHSGIPPGLQSLLEDESSVKVGVCIGGDAAKMQKDYNVHVREIEDLAAIACRKLRPPRKWSLSCLCEKLTGKEVDKPKNIRCGNWEVDNLNIPQLQYAATDAYASWYLYE